MFGIDVNRDILGPENIFETVSNLLRESLLNLRATREKVRDAIDF